LKERTGNVYEDKGEGQKVRRFDDLSSRFTDDWKLTTENSFERNEPGTSMKTKEKNRKSDEFRCQNTDGEAGSSQNNNVKIEGTNSISLLK
jgi:hypothetical protein